MMTSNCHRAGEVASSFKEKGARGSRGVVLISFEGDVYADCPETRDPEIPYSARVEEALSEVAGSGASKEQERLTALYQLDILDTRAEQEYDDLTALAACVCKTPIAVFALVDRDRQWMKSKVGLGTEQTPRDESICTYTVEETDLFIVPDATFDERFLCLPPVLDGTFRFYAGAPVRSPDGLNVGSLCVMDTEPRVLTEEQKAALRMLGGRVSATW
jgi:GAF domain-containing protein